jgi:hypothetical protein
MTLGSSSLQRQEKEAGTPNSCESDFQPTLVWHARVTLQSRNNLVGN